MYYDEKYVAEWVSEKCTGGQLSLDLIGAKKWLNEFNENQKFPLSEEQYDTVFQIAQQSFSILTGGPGCGKTTTTNTLVKLLLALKKEVILAAPTGRAAQRMGEVIGREAKTIHRLLIWEPQTGRFKKNEEDVFSFKLKCQQYMLRDSISHESVSTLLSEWVRKSRSIIHPSSIQDPTIAFNTTTNFQHNNNKIKPSQGY